MYMINLIVFFASLACLVLLFWNKQKELTLGKPLMDLSFGSDESIKQRIERVRHSTKDLPKRAFHLTAFYTVKHGLNIFEKSKQVVYPKIAHIVDAVKGRDIPRNRGAVSLFLKHIEERRRSHSNSH